MNIFRPTSKSANRVIDIAARVILVIADIAIILLFYIFIGLSISLASEQEINILTGIILFLLATVIVGIAFSFLKPRIGSILLFIPVITLVIVILWFVVL